MTKKKEISRCGRRTHSCRKCEHRYPKAERDLWTCPKCGEDRHCKKIVKEPGLACGIHGGKSLKGPASPSWKYGIYSEHMPRHLLEAYHKFLTDPQRLSVEGEIAVASALLADQLQKLDSIGTADAWVTASRLFGNVAKALDKGENTKATKLLKKLGKVLQDGAGVPEQLEQTRRYLDTLRRLKDTEMDIVEKKDQLVPLSWVIGMIMKLSEVWNEEFAPLEGSTKPIRRIQGIIGEFFGKLPARKITDGS